MSIVTQGYSGQALVTQGYGDSTFITVGITFTIDTVLKFTDLQAPYNIDTVLTKEIAKTFLITVALSKDGIVISPDEYEWITDIQRDNLWTSIER